MNQTLCLAAAVALVLVACARPGQDDEAAFKVCMEAAMKDPKFAKAKFVSREQANIQASTGDADIRVNVPYELEGKKGLYQCIAAKQVDGTYKVAF